MKVIVFGGSGFLGSHIADALSEAGHEVTIYDLVKSPFLKSNQKMICGDILDEKAIEKAIEGQNIVYNFAGIADLEEARQRPLDSVKYNILGNTILLEACRKNKIKRFVFASSLYVYSKAGSFYRSTKQACELLIENYHEAYDLDYTILRYGSLYGPRSDGRNFIYHAVQQALTEKKIVRQGDGEELREYIHVYDAAKGSVEVLKEDFKNEYVILSGTQQMKVKNLLLMIKEMLDNTIEIEYISLSNDDYHYEITPYTFAPKLAKKLISQSYLDLGQGILDVIHILYKELNPLPVYDKLFIKE